MVGEKFEMLPVYAVMLVDEEKGGYVSWRDEAGLPVAWNCADAAEERARALNEKGQQAFVAMIYSVES